MTSIVEKASNPYFELCHVNAEPLKSELLRLHACHVGGDTDCLAEIATKLVGATPLP